MRELHPLKKRLDSDIQIVSSSTVHSLSNPRYLRRWNISAHDSILIYQHFFALLRACSSLVPLLAHNCIRCIAKIYDEYVLMMLMNNAQRICTIIIASLLYDIFLVDDTTKWVVDSYKHSHNKKQAHDNYSCKSINNNNSEFRRKKMQLQWPKMDVHFHTVPPTPCTVYKSTGFLRFELISALVCRLYVLFSLYNFFLDCFKLQHTLVFCLRVIFFRNFSPFKSSQQKLLVTMLLTPGQQTATKKKRTNHHSHNSIGIVYYWRKSRRKQKHTCAYRIFNRTMHCDVIMPWQMFCMENWKRFTSFLSACHQQIRLHGDREKMPKLNSNAFRIITHSSFSTAAAVNGQNSNESKI